MSIIEQQPLPNASGHVSYHRKKEKWRARINVTTADSAYRLSVGQYRNYFVAHECANMAADVFNANGGYITESDVYDIKRHFFNIDQRAEPTPRAEPGQSFDDYMSL